MIGGSRRSTRSRPGTTAIRVGRWGIGLVGAGVVAALAAWRGAATGGEPSRFWRAAIAVAGWLDREVGWDRLPTPLGLGVLVALRRQLRRENLHEPRVAQFPQPPLVASGTGHLTARTADGMFNDLAQPGMGSAGTRFGRNVGGEAAGPAPAQALLSPNPRIVSRELMTRERFQPAETLNVLAAAWIQFMIRDWFSHGRSPKEDPWVVPLAADDPWPQEARPMTILRTPGDPTRPAGASGPPTHVNTETHWWDASQLYGSNEAYQRRVRSGVDGKLAVDGDGLPAVDPLSPEHPADVPGFWLGLGLLHTLFVREHNAICDRFKAEYPAWSDDDIFAHARLVNAALLAKIHTVEWTPAIIGHPTTRIAMRANWWGLQGERLSRLVGRLSGSEVVSGIPGAPTDHFGVPYALTEEFVAVYRMHPLIPDEYRFHGAADHRFLLERDLAGVAQRAALEVLERVPMADLFYSLGVAHPGAISLHNFPRGLQQFQRPDGHLQDLAATDILRTRELGVPRYNAFRRLLHLRPVASFEELTDDPEWAAEMRRVYDGEIEQVDLIVGMLAEPKPARFGFSDTAFRIFILMASRRLNSDRFFTVDFTPRVYTQTGLDWIADNDMSTVLLRHFPALGASLRGVGNAFQPWARAG